MTATGTEWHELPKPHTNTALPTATSPMAATAQAYLQNLVLSYLRPIESQ